MNEEHCSSAKSTQSFTGPPKHTSATCDYILAKIKFLPPAAETLRDAYTFILPLRGVCVLQSGILKKSSAVACTYAQSILLHTHPHHHSVAGCRSFRFC